MKGKVLYWDGHEEEVLAYETWPESGYNVIQFVTCTGTYLFLRLFTNGFMSRGYTMHVNNFLKLCGYESEGLSVQGYENFSRNPKWQIVYDIKEVSVEKEESSCPLCERANLTNPTFEGIRVRFRSI